MCKEPYGEIQEDALRAPVTLRCNPLHEVCTICLPKLQSNSCPHCRAGIFPSATPTPTDPAPELTQQAVEQLGGGVAQGDALSGSDAGTEGDDNEPSLIGNE